MIVVDLLATISSCFYQEVLSIPWTYDVINLVIYVRLSFFSTYLENSQVELWPGEGEKHYC